MGSSGNEPTPGMASDDDAVARWLALKKERGCLPRTIHQYRWVARRATTVLRRSGRPADPRAWSAEDARWLRYRLHDDPWQLAVLADLARTSRNFVFHEVGLPRPRPPRRVRWLTEVQARAVLDVSRNDPLLRLVVLLGLGQGLRRIEWIRLRTEDLDLAGRRLLVRGKGRGTPKLAWMPMHPALPEALKGYLEWRERAVRRQLRRWPLELPPPELLLHRKGERLVPYGEGGPNGWMRILERRLERNGVEVKLSTHMFRRSGATLLERTLLESPAASRDGVYRSVQEFLRHQNLSTTMRYLETDPARQRRAMDLFGAALGDWGSTPAAPVGPGALGETSPRAPAARDQGTGRFVPAPALPGRQGRRRKLERREPPPRDGP